MYWDSECASISDVHPPNSIRTVTVDFQGYTFCDVRFHTCITINTCGEFICSQPFSIAQLSPSNFLSVNFSIIHMTNFCLDYLVWHPAIIPLIEEILFAANLMRTGRQGWGWARSQFSGYLSHTRRHSLTCLLEYKSCPVSILRCVGNTSVFIILHRTFPL